MAFKRNFLDDPKQQGQALGTGGIIGAGAKNDQASPAPQQTAGSGWANLQQYLDANKGETGGLVDTFVGANNRSIDKAKGIGDDLVKKVSEDEKYTEQERKAKGLTDTLKSGDVTKIDVNDYNNTAGGTYAYNKDTYDYGNINYDGLGYGNVLKAFSDAGNNVKNATNYDSQKSMLQTEFGGMGNYGAGASTLDTFLMRGDASSKGAIQNFQDANKSYIADPGKNSAEFDSRVKGNLDTFFDEKADAFKTAQAGLGTARDERVKSYNDTINARLSDMSLGDNSSGYLDAAKGAYDAELSNLGLSGYGGDVDFSKFLSANEKFGAEDIATDDEWAALAALEDLGAAKTLDSTKRGDQRYTFDQAGADEARASAVDSAWMGLVNQFNQGNAKAAEDLKRALDTGVLTQAVLDRISPNLPPGPTSLSVNNLKDRILNPNDITSGVGNVTGAVGGAGQNAWNTATGKKKLW